MLTVFLTVLFFALGLMLRPKISKYIKNNFEIYSKINVYDIEFRIEFYNQPSLHHEGENGVLVKSPPIKIQIRSTDEEEALISLESIIRQEVKGELISIKEVPKV